MGESVVFEERLVEILGEHQRWKGKTIGSDRDNLGLTSVKHSICFI